ncbi:MAG: hypothetical protein JW829_14480, partial [Pirellulales bacterium]|nr:hypothetical protein [Pirellulales bacterium]
KGTWVRVRVNRDCAKATVFFHYSNERRLGDRAVDSASQTTTKGLLHVRGENRRTLGFATGIGYYEMGADLKLKRVFDANAEEYLRKSVAIPKNVLTTDSASILYVDDAGQRWRLPSSGDGCPMDDPFEGRVDREVCTERDIFNAGGTFYELPADNAGGFAKIRPITTHNQHIKDYCSYLGMLVMSGATGKSPHIIHSDDGQASLWIGVIDDLWQFGKPRGAGGPWKETTVQAGLPSDPYLMNGFDKKSLSLSSESSVIIRVEVDLTGTGLWRTWQRLEVTPNKVTEYQFPDAFSAYWVRVVADRDCRATAWFEYH